VVLLDSNWPLERVIAEAKQVAVNPQLAPQQGDESAGVPFEQGAEFQGAEFQGAEFQGADQQQRKQCCPNLDLQGVSRSTDESLDPQVLFDALEEELSGKGLARG
jgi:hypothetical protein